MAAKTKDAERERAWDGIVRRSLDFECKAIDEEERSLEVVASTDTLDSYGDIVEQTFNLKRYRKNPVVLWMHNAFGWFDGSGAEDFLPIGRAESVKIEDGKLTAKLIFVSGDGPDSVAEKVWRRVQQGVLRAVSIGFRPGKITEEKREGGTVYRLADNELFEISVVPIPANPDAVAKSIALQHEHFRRALAADGNEQPVRESADKDNDMDPKELQAQLDKVKGELAVANAALETAKTTAKADAEKADAKVKELEGKISGLETKCAELLKSVNALTEQNARYAESEKVAQNAAAEADVDAVVGKKIMPASREKFLAIRLRSKAEFDGLLADMPELPHLKEITPPAPNPGTGGDLKSLIEEAKSA